MHKTFPIIERPRSISINSWMNMLSELLDEYDALTISATHSTIEHVPNPSELATQLQFVDHNDINEFVAAVYQSLHPHETLTQYLQCDELAQPNNKLKIILFSVWIAANVKHYNESTSFQSCHHKTDSACPFANTYESDHVQNLGCLPTRSDIITMRQLHGKTWACHEHPSKPCAGAIRALRKLGIEHKVIDPELLTEQSDWSKYC